MNSLYIKILKLDKCLREFCSPLYAKMLPPLKDDDIDDCLKKVGMDDEALKQVFLWKNGIDNDGSLPTNAYDYTEFGVIPPLQYIVNILQDKDIKKYWKETYFPLVLSFAGDFLLYETDKSSTSYGQLFLYCPTFGYVYEQPSFYDSIESMIDTIVNSFEEEVFKYDAKAMTLNVDFEKNSVIAKKYNSKSEYWQS